MDDAQKAKLAAQMTREGLQDRFEEARREQLRREAERAIEQAWRARPNEEERFTS